MGTQVYSVKREIPFTSASWAAVYMCEQFAEHRNSKEGEPWYEPFYDEGIYAEEVKKANDVTPADFEKYKKYCEAIGRPERCRGLDEESFIRARRFIKEVAEDGDGFSVSY